MTLAVARTTGLVVLALLVPGAARAGAEAPHRIGLVTRVTGEASVVRAAQPEPRPLRFKDDVVSGDVVRTTPQSLVRVLLYGTTLVAAGESSAVRIVDDRGRTTLGLETGKLSVIVTRSVGRPDDQVEIRTPHAVVTLRGTSVVAEVAPAAGPGVEARTSLWVLSGEADVRPDGASRAITVRAFESVSVTAAGASAVRALAADAATRLMQDFRLTPQQPDAPGEAMKSIGERGQAEAEAEARALRRQGVKGIPSMTDPARRPVVPIQPQIPAGQGPRACC